MAVAGGLSRAGGLTYAGKAVSVQPCPAGTVMTINNANYKN